MTVLEPTRRSLHAWHAGMEPGKAPEHHSGERWSQEYMIFEEKSGDAGAEPLTYLGFVLISALPSQFETELYTDIS